MMKKNNFGFSLIEIMLGILIFSIVMVMGFDSVTTILVSRVKLIEKTSINKQAYFFSERLIEEIKQGGTIDYEEYFNRKVIGTNTSSGYFSTKSGFGNFGKGGTVGSNNFGSGIYYCYSSGTLMGTGGCYNKPLNNTLSSNLGNQRYLQYLFQYTDFNANADTDGGDQNNNGSIIGDDDDENLGNGPETFTGGTNTTELYLISGNGKKRTFFRRSVKLDPYRASGETCDFITATGTGCLGTVEFLKLDGKDWGVNHSKSGTGSYDGIIDTWIIDPNFSGGSEVIAGSDNKNYRLKLFGDDINVKSFKIYPYPNKNIKYAWKDFSPQSNISPYVRIELILLPSWKKRKQMRGIPPEVKIATTINLADYFSK